jgi:hypothetical protein
VKAIIETPTFLASARDVGLPEELRSFIVETIADDPMMGDMMAGTGGCRKSRFAGRGRESAAAIAQFTTTARMMFRSCYW